MELTSGQLSPNEKAKKAPEPVETMMTRVQRHLEMQRDTQRGPAQQDMEAVKSGRDQDGAIDMDDGMAGAMEELESGGSSIEQRKAMDVVVHIKEENFIL